MSRARMSLPPPGGNGTIRRTERLGNDRLANGGSGERERHPCQERAQQAVDRSVHGASACFRSDGFASRPPFYWIEHCSFYEKDCALRPFCQAGARLRRNALVLVALADGESHPTNMLCSSASRARTDVAKMKTKTVEKRAGAAPDSSGVAAVDRALAIMDAFEPDGQDLALTEIAGRTGMYKSTILRLADSLLKFGYLQRLEDGRYQVGPRPFSLGAIYQRSLHVGDVVRPQLGKLAKLTGESASFYVLQDTVRVCLYRIDSRHEIRDHVREGDVFPLSRGSGGGGAERIFRRPRRALRRRSASPTTTSPSASATRKRPASRRRCSAPASGCWDPSRFPGRGPGSAKGRWTRSASLCCARRRTQRARWVATRRRSSGRRRPSVQRAPAARASGSRCVRLVDAQGLHDTPGGARKRPARIRHGGFRWPGKAHPVR